MAKKKSVIPEVAAKATEVEETEVSKIVPTAAQTEWKVKMAAAPAKAKLGIGYPSAGSKTETAHVQACRKFLLGDYPDATDGRMTMPCI